MPTKEFTLPLSRSMPNLARTTALDAAARRYEHALARLREAYDCAQDVGRSAWDFAVRIDVLTEQGAAEIDLRWLVCRDYVEHADEVFAKHNEGRKFETAAKNNLVFSDRTCFILTEAGARWMRQRGDLSSNGHPSASAPTPPCAEILIPSWDRDRQELRIDGQVVKHFRVPAPNQELVLSSFEEEGWPVHIHDPLPPHSELAPKQRLHDTISSLNRNQKVSLIRFSGNGKGNGIRWKVIAENIARLRSER